VLAQEALTAGLRNAQQLGIGQVESGERCFGVIGQKNFLARTQEVLQPRPRVAQEGCTTGCGLE